MIANKSPLVLLGVAVATTLTSDVVTATPTFMSRIPNGFSVVGVDGQPWAAVGHNMASAGAPLNPFGEAFKAAGLQWTVDLCQMDSDGDGRTNGEELGDPDCVWPPGATPARTTDISHPGFFNEGFADAVVDGGVGGVGDEPT